MPVLTPVMAKQEIAGRLVRALGITFQVERLVIEMDCSKPQPVRVYVKAPVDRKAFEEMVKLFETVQVESVEVEPDTSLSVTGAR